MAENSRAGPGIAPLGCSLEMAGTGVRLHRGGSPGGEWGAPGSGRSTHWLWAPEQQRSKPVTSSHSAKGNKKKWAKAIWQQYRQRDCAAWLWTQNRPTRRKQPPSPPTLAGNPRLALTHHDTPAGRGVGGQKPQNKTKMDMG